MTDPFLDNTGNNGASITFKNLEVGHVMQMRATGSPTSTQAKDFSSQEPVYWHPSRKGKRTTTPNDRPVMLAVIPCEAVSNVYTKDGLVEAGEPVAIMATIFGSDLFFKVNDARIANGAKYVIKEGDAIAVKLTNRTPTDNGNDKNVHAVKITPAAPPAAADPFATSAPATSSAPQLGDEPPF